MRLSPSFLFWLRRYGFQATFGILGGLIVISVALFVSWAEASSVPQSIHREPKPKASDEMDAKTIVESISNADSGSEVTAPRRSKSKSRGPANDPATSTTVATPDASSAAPTPTSTPTPTPAAPAPTIPVAPALATPVAKPSPLPAATPSTAAPSIAPSTAPNPEASNAPPPAATGATGMVSVTRVVGEVSENIITSRETQINNVIEQAVFGRLPGYTKIRILKGTEKSFPSDVQAVLREWVIYLEAKSFGSEQMPKADIQKAIRTVQEGTADLEGWAALEASPQEISEIVERKLVAKKFLRLKLDSAQVPITEAEALAYFKKNRLKFGNLPFASFRDNIKTFLIKQQMDRRLQEWIEVLERRYKVRNFIAG